MENRREFERFDLELPASVEAETSGQKNEIFSLKTSNISAGGTFFPTNRPLPEGKQVQLNIILGIQKLKELIVSQCHIIVRGTVVRSEKTGVAIRFQRNYKIVSTKCSKLPSPPKAWLKAYSLH